MHLLLDNKRLTIVIAFSLASVFLLVSRGLFPSVPSSSLLAASNAIHQEPSATSTDPISPAPEPTFFHYIEITQGCGPYYDTGTCVNMRSAPATTSLVVARLRTGAVLKVEDTLVTHDGLEWYKIIFDGYIRNPERITGDWYVAANPSAVEPHVDVGDQLQNASTTPTNKRIVVNLTEEMLYAYDGDTLFMQAPISTGLRLTPTPQGSFTVFKKTPSRYMQGPIPGVSDQVYDLPGVPWNLYFSGDGAVIHGAYWHDHFGEPWSHGCVNLSTENAKRLYAWADVGTKVLVK